MNKFVLPTLFSLAVLLGACNGGNSDKHGISSNDVAKEAKEAIGTTVDYAKQERARYVQQVQKELDDIQAKIQQLKADTQNAGADAKAKMDKKVQELQQQWQSSRDKLSDLKSASDEAWGEVKSGVGKAVDELKKSYEKAKEKFED